MESIFVEESKILDAVEKGESPKKAVLEIVNDWIDSYAEEPDYKAYGEKIKFRIEKDVMKVDVKLADPGKLYQVELAPKDDEYLLWDKPLSEQSEKVKAALEGLDVPQNMTDHFKKWLAVEYPSFSEDFYVLSSAQRKTIVEDYARTTGKASPVPFNLRDGDRYYQMLYTTIRSDKAAS